MISICVDPEIVCVCLDAIAVSLNKVNIQFVFQAPVAHGIRDPKHWFLWQNPIWREAEPVGLCVTTCMGREIVLPGSLLSSSVTHSIVLSGG